MEKYYTATNKNTPGFLGFALIFIALLMGLVIVVEYDPAMVKLKSGGHSVEGVITGKKRKAVKRNTDSPSALNALRFSRDKYYFQVTFKTAHNETVKAVTEPFSTEHFWKSRKTGDTIDLTYIKDGNKIVVACSEVLPSTPRGESDLVFPVIVLLTGVALVVLYPSVLYTMR